MNNPNECGVTAVLHLRGAGPLSIDVFELTSPSDNMVERYSVSIGAGVRMQEIVLFLDPDQLVQLSAGLEVWARSIQAAGLPKPIAAAVDPQQDDELIDVRGGQVMSCDNVHWLTIQGEPEVQCGQLCGILLIETGTEFAKVGLTEEQITTLISALQALRGRVAAFRKELQN